MGAANSGDRLQRIPVIGRGDPVEVPHSPFLFARGPTGLPPRCTVCFALIRVGTTGPAVLGGVQGYFEMFGLLLGGLGLFLLAVGMISDGMKTAAGRQLRNILDRWTGTPARGIAVGALVTALVQSSSAVTVATIGFVNAGILGLSPALGLVFGANVGTTMTSWLVAAVGFDFRLEVVALPLIGIGMFLRLTGRGTRRGALGEALAGFGLFFVAIDMLRDAFAGLAADMALQELSVADPLQLLLLVGTGFLLTVLTQSSSAAIAMILTAASGAMVPLAGAAAMVIGANIGTTSTAVLAAIGATPNAKRVAAAHVLFNVVAGVFALSVLPILLWLVETTGQQLGIAAAPAVTLALFHTVSKLLGVLVMWPLSGRLAGFLERRFRTGEEDEGQPRFIDRTVAAAPALAVDAVEHELLRVADIARRMGQAAVSAESSPGRQIARDAGAARHLGAAIGTFVERLGRESLSHEVAEQLPQTLRVLQYLLTGVDLAEGIAGAVPGSTPLADPALGRQLADYRAAVAGFLRDIDPQQPAFSVEALARREAVLEERYQLLKAALLQGGALNRIGIPDMTESLGLISRCRRLAQQLFKGAALLGRLHGGASPEAVTG